MLEQLVFCISGFPSKEKQTEEKEEAEGCLNFIKKLLNCDKELSRLK